MFMQGINVQPFYVLKTLENKTKGLVVDETLATQPMYTRPSDLQNMAKNPSEQPQRTRHRSAPQAPQCSVVHGMGHAGWLLLQPECSAFSAALAWKSPLSALFCLLCPSLGFLVLLWDP